MNENGIFMKCPDLNIVKNEEDFDIEMEDYIEENQMEDYIEEKEMEDYIEEKEMEDFVKEQHKNIPTNCIEFSSSLCVSSVSDIQQLNFSQLLLDEQLAIKKRGCSTPGIQVSQTGVSNNKRYVRNFNRVWYKRKNWLCGCEVKNALFCFPCLLYGGDETWTKNGFNKINRLKEQIQKHENSKKHIQNAISLSLLGSVDIKQQFSDAYRLSIIKHNKKVTKNREILSKIIDCVTFCGNFEIPLCGHNQTNDSENPDIFRGLIDFKAKSDSDLKNHLENNRVFKDISKTIHNELLDCLLHIYHDEIKKDIKQASFVAVTVDDITDVSEHTEMVIILRYVLNEEIFERFWGFFIPQNQTADGISECIQEQLDIILQGDKQKLISQTFDGANVMKGKKGDVQAKIKAVYNNAHFIHCYAHQLNQIMRNAASVTQGSRIFFGHLLGIPTFFSRSQQRLSILRKFMNFGIPNPSPRYMASVWNSHIRTLNKVYENLEPLKSCLAEIRGTTNMEQTILEASAILNFLNDEKFIFWLELFHQMAPHVEKIYTQMQSREINAFKVNEYITNFNGAILEIKNFCESPSKNLLTEAQEVCDCLRADIMERYSFATHLVAAKLFDKKRFTRFMNKFPTENVRLTAEDFSMIDKERLEIELKVFYGRSDIHEYRKLIDLLKFILKNNLGDILGEMVKLIKILLTIPMTTSEPERYFSTLKRIKTFLRRTMNQERLTAHAMISTEKHFFNSTPNLKEKAIDLFSQNKRRIVDFRSK